MPSAENNWVTIGIVKSGRKLIGGIASGVAALFFVFITVTDKGGSHILQGIMITIFLAVVSFIFVRAYLAAKNKNAALNVTDSLIRNNGVEYKLSEVSALRWVNVEDDKTFLIGIGFNIGENNEILVPLESNVLDVMDASIAIPLVKSVVMLTGATVADHSRGYVTKAEAIILLDGGSMDAETPPAPAAPAPAAPTRPVAPWG